MTKRDTIIAGNWKMHKSLEEGELFLREIMPAIEKSPDKIYLAVPFTHIKPLGDNFTNERLFIGAQNMNDASEGAFTGEIAAFMLKEASAKFVLLGHSERRHIFGESNEFIQKKVRKALDEELQPILCVGETLQDRKTDKTEEILREQLLTSLEGVSAGELEKMAIAYEPVWAIGTGMTATPEQAEEAHRFVRGVIAKKWSKRAADKVPILYGGSVTPDNVKQLLSRGDIDGVLVGGASLKSDAFVKIINYQTA